MVDVYLYQTISVFDTNVGIVVDCHCYVWYNIIESEAFPLIGFLARLHAGSFVGLVVVKRGPLDRN